MNILKNPIFYAVILAVAVVSVFSWLVFTTLPGDKKPDEKPVGSVALGNEYHSTGTPWNGVNVSHYLKMGQGALGSLVITKAGDTEFYLLDATTSPELPDAYATSSDELAHIPASLAAGTYTFDVAFTDGLYFYVVGGNTGTSTVTFR